MCVFGCLLVIAPIQIGCLFETVPPGVLQICPHFTAGCADDSILKASEPLGDCVVTLVKMAQMERAFLGFPWMDTAQLNLEHTSRVSPKCEHESNSKNLLLFPDAIKTMRRFEWGRHHPS